MKRLLGLVAVAYAIVGAEGLAQSVSVGIVKPGANVIVWDNVFVAATASGTFEIQAVNAAAEGRHVDLVYTSAAYQDKFGRWLPGWTNTLSLAGTSRGTKSLIVTATDAFGGSGQAIVNVVHDLPPVLNLVDIPANGSCARPTLHIEYSASDDDPAGVQVQIWRTDPIAWQLLASATNTLVTNLNLMAYDGGAVGLSLQATDSANQTVRTSRVVYVASSTNLVLVDQVSDGGIMDVTPDQILFQTSDITPALKIKTRTNGTETLVYAQPAMSVVSGMITPRGVLFENSGPSHQYVQAYAWNLWQNGSAHELMWLGLYGIGLASKGNLATWGWGFQGGYPEVGLTDLQTLQSVAITNFNATFDLTFDLNEQGDVYFAPTGIYATGQGLFRYRNGTITLLASDPSTTFSAVKATGYSVYYVKSTASTQSLARMDGATEVTLAQGTSIGTDYLVNNGWVAFERTASGQAQVWRRTPDGTNQQLTFWGNSSTLAGLAPNGDVAFYNGSQLYISHGEWPPYFVATGTSLRPFWQNQRWYAWIGRCLFQLYSGTPQITSSRVVPGPALCFDLVAAGGQSVVVESSTDLQSWTPCNTNTVSDGSNLQVLNAIPAGVPHKYYRLHLR